MILDYGASYFRDMLRYQSYVKAQSHINAFSEEPKDILSPTFIEMGEEMSFCNYVPEVLGRLHYSTCLDYPGEKFGRCVSNIQVNVQERMAVEFGGLFHFGLLMDHLHLFTENEEVEWRLRVDRLFQDFSDNCMNFYEFYETNFKTNFFGGDSPAYMQFKNHMNFTYVILCDFEYHTTEDFGPDFMGTYSKFAEEYYQFYKDLIEEIQKRKRG